MKKIIPFNKDICFNSDIYEISSISLEHSIKLEKENSISGEFVISGEYKETESDLNSKPFIYNIPFNIDLDTKYSDENIKIDIDNFEYDVISNNTLNIVITISLNGIEIIEDTSPIEIYDEKYKEEEKVEEDLFQEENNYDILDVMKEDTREVDDISIFNNFDEKNDKYVTYSVHIYREKDDLNEIMKNYNVTKEELEEYNDLSNLTLGNKIIIPFNE